jgi:Ni2+-binding GTPase involved in maturation of urease and hydrogenase
MKLVTVAGPPSCGKTSLIVKTCRHLMDAGTSCAVVKFDCLQSRDDGVYQAADIPVIVALSGGLCPDHFLASNLEEAFA